MTFVTRWRLTPGAEPLTSREKRFCLSLLVISLVWQFFFLKVDKRILLSALDHSIYLTSAAISLGLLALWLQCYPVVFKRKFFPSPLGIMAFVALVMIVVTGLPALNAKMDNAPVSVHETLLLEKTGKYKSILIVESWRKERKIEKFYGGFHHDISQLIPGKTRLRVTTKPGRFGWEWVVDFDVPEAL